MRATTRIAMGALLLSSAIAVTALLAAEVIFFGAPRLATTAFAISLSALTIAWPLITRETFNVPMCRDCHGPAWGLRRFGFCIRCGSTRGYERSS